MSTVEISKEERDLWRFEASDECGTPSEDDERILRLLKALEASEADLERSCEETRANFSELYRMANDVVPELKRRAEKAEAENTRLRAVLTAVEEIALAAPELNMNNYDEDQVSTLNEAMIGVCGILLKEAARRAAADSGNGVEA